MSNPIASESAMRLRQTIFPIQITCPECGEGLTSDGRRVWSSCGYGRNEIITIEEANGTTSKQDEKRS